MIICRDSPLSEWLTATLRLFVGMSGDTLWVLRGVTLYNVKSYALAFAMKEHYTLKTRLQQAKNAGFCGAVQFFFEVFPHFDWTVLHSSTKPTAQYCTVKLREITHLHTVQKGV